MIELKVLDTIAADCNGRAREKGFWDKERNVGETMALITSELSEALSAHQKGRFANLEAFEKDIESGRDFIEAFREHIKDSYEDEYADAFIRLFDAVGGYGIPISKYIEYKMEFNLSRERHNGKRY